MINFRTGTPNRLLSNPRLPDGEKQVLSELQKKFEEAYSRTDYFLIPSSGSSKTQNQSVKLVALSLTAVLNSAKRFNTYFSAGPSDHWGLVLPEFHVAGLGVCARAFLTGARVFKMDWKASEFAIWLEKNQIAFVSLVPAQVFDLVQIKAQAPASVKKVLVGAGALNQELQRKMRELGWPVVETYGMTETASMIAVRQNAQLFEVLPGVDVRAGDDTLTIKCDSLLTAVVQKNGENVSVLGFEKNEWYRTEDLVQLTTEPPKSFLHFLGRKGDYVKILGEGVSLTELRSRLESVMIELGQAARHAVLLSTQDERAGAKLVLIVEPALSPEDITQLIDAYHQQSRPYERISRIIKFGPIPRTDLGKLKAEELKSILGL